MRIVDLLSKNSIKLNASPKSKSEAIDMLIDLQVKGGNIADKEAYKKGILAREEKGSTAVGEGIAIPHAKSEAVKAPSLAAMTVPDGVDYEALDDEPSNLLFMIAAPNDGDVHLEVLSRLMTILMDEDFRDDLLKAKREGRDPVMIPRFSCHITRHTFCTRLCENETNVKVIQQVMGHKDIQTTLDIYAEVSEKKRQEVFKELNNNDII